METTDWREIESRVHRPERWAFFAIAAFFLLFAAVSLVACLGAPPGATLWAARLAVAICALAGAAALLTGCRACLPVYVRHTDPAAMPDVPDEPVIEEGAVVYGRLMHELVMEAEGWQFRSDARIARIGERSIIGFGVPFMALAAALLAWALHRDNFGGWPVSILCAVAVTVACGGPGLVLMRMLMRARQREPCRLSIPPGGGDLVLDFPQMPDPEQFDLVAGLKWAFQIDVERRRLAIPRELIRAVQLCPWKHAVGGGRFGTDATWAAQGLLVVSSATDAALFRLPVLLTADFVGAAHLMRTLAEALVVPYLFCADAQGCEAESRRAKSRPPLRMGGSVQA